MRMNRIREPLTKYHFRKIIVIACFRTIFNASFSTQRWGYSRNLHKPVLLYSYYRTRHSFIIIIEVIGNSFSHALLSSIVLRVYQFPLFFLTKLKPTFCRERKANTYHLSLSLSREQRYFSPLKQRKLYRLSMNTKNRVFFFSRRKMARSSHRQTSLTHINFTPKVTLQFRGRLELLLPEKE